MSAAAGTKIYLACPYSHPNRSVRAERFRRVSKAAAELVRAGLLVYSPISHSHPLSIYGQLAGDFETWRALDYEFIRWADELWLLGLAGWQGSRGVREELAIAEELARPVVLLDERLNRRAWHGPVRPVEDLTRAVWSREISDSRPQKGGKRCD